MVIKQRDVMHSLPVPVSIRFLTTMSMPRYRFLAFSKEASASQQNHCMNRYEKSQTSHDMRANVNLRTGRYSNQGYWYIISECTV